MLREGLVIDGTVEVDGQFIVPKGPLKMRPTSPDIGSLYLEESSIHSNWTDYGGNSANYTVTSSDSIIIKNSSTGWIGFFPATINNIGNHVVRFTYVTDSGTSSLVMDNDGVNDNEFNRVLSVTTTPQTYSGTIAITATGAINFFLRHNSGGGNITISDFRFFPEGSAGSRLMTYTAVSNNDGGWEPVGSQTHDRTAFKYRQVINFSYTAGGYKSSSPWKTVHRTTNSTDQTVNIGDLMDYPASYTSGACSKTKLFIWSTATDGLWKSATQVDGTHTTGIDMVNETAYAHQSKWDLLNARDDCGTLFKETEFAWIFGGSISTVEKFNLTNETMYTNYYNYASPYTITQTSLTSTLGASGFSDENYGYGYGSESGNKLFFANDTFVSAQRWASSGQQKGISSKWGKGYAGNEGTYNGGYNLRRWDVFTETNIGNVAKPHPNCGEENFTMGQDHQYMIGVYDGSGQSNNSWKFSYSTDTGVVNPTGLPPTAHAGQSSGHCGWRS
jgi:hypothetical protein